MNHYDDVFDQNQEGQKKRWFHKPRRVFIVVTVCSGVSLLYFTHLILIPKAVERWLGEIVFEMMKVEWKGKLLTVGELG
ncbi:transmembrane protein, putative [Medicago truncatula]|uniref:Transmembrane protein, putative n=1 Tax=Medicago truncatula TaxID=3880 RepID=A0A072U6I6_MEDTR|nr:transmembrane protein, putative [Medicago truncatula]